MLMLWRCCTATGSGVRGGVAGGSAEGGGGAAGGAGRPAASGSGPGRAQPPRIPAASSGPEEEEPPVNQRGDIHGEAAEGEPTPPPRHLMRARRSDCADTMHRMGLVSALTL